MLTDGRTTDGRTPDAGVTGILIAHLGAFGSGELKNKKSLVNFLNSDVVLSKGVTGFSVANYS